MIQTKNLFKWSGLLLLALLILASCKKDDEEEDPPEDTPEEQVATTPTPDFAVGDGAVIAVQAITVTQTDFGPIETNIGTGVAVFTDDLFQTFHTAGNVSLNSNDLTVNENNSYTYIPDITNPLGIVFAGTVNWEVSGGNGTPAFSLDLSSQGFPDVDPISSSTTVPLSGYTLTTTNVSNADSVLFLIGDVQRTLGPGSTSCTFTADDLSGLSAGSSFAQIAAYNHSINDIGSGQNIHGINETVQTVSVTLE